MTSHLICEGERHHPAHNRIGTEAVLFLARCTSILAHARKSVSSMLRDRLYYCAGISRQNRRHSPWLPVSDRSSQVAKLSNSRR